MTKLDIRPSLPLESSASPLREVRRVLWQILIVNLLVAGAKVAVGIATDSISILADGFHSTLDGSSNVIGLVGLSIAVRPPDKDHPYGHQKFETFATLGIGLLLLLASWNVLTSAFSRVIEGSAPEVTLASFAVMIVTLLANGVVTTYESRQGRRLDSSILLADAAHTRSDIFVSLSVLTGLVAVELGWPWADALVAVMIVAFIAHTGWQIIRRAAFVLADSAALDPAQVQRIALSVAGVRSCHKIRSRSSGQAIYLDMHIQVNGQITLAEAHRLGHLVQAQLKQQLGVADVIVHVEPEELAQREDGAR